MIRAVLTRSGVHAKVGGQWFTLTVSQSITHLQSEGDCQRRHQSCTLCPRCQQNYVSSNLRLIWDRDYPERHSIVCEPRTILNWLGPRNNVKRQHARSVAWVLTEHFTRRSVICLMQCHEGSQPNHRSSAIRRFSSHHVVLTMICS